MRHVELEKAVQRGAHEEHGLGVGDRARRRRGRIRIRDGRRGECRGGDGEEEDDGGSFHGTNHTADPGTGQGEAGADLTRDGGMG